MSNKDLQKKRILIYFIEAAQTIISEEGISSITIRKVAHRAGYNSATLYNYFDNLDHLILYASLKYLHLYNEDFKKHMDECSSAKEHFLQMWKSFCFVSFQQPEPFEHIFFCKYSEQLEHIAAQYYDLFPEEKINASDDLNPIFSSINLSHRNGLALNLLYQEEQRNTNQLEITNNLMLFAYHELLSQCAAHAPKNEIELQEYMDRMFVYINYLLTTHNTKE